jgi:MoxR-like ATPase
MSEKPGLWDRVLLVLMMSHYRVRDVDAWEAPLARDLDFAQNRIDRNLAAWSLDRQHYGRVENELLRLTASPMFRSIETGVSPRGLLDWPRAAIAEAFLDDAHSLPRREHFRRVAGDVLRHRLRLTPSARADGITPDRVIEALVDALLADHPSEDDQDRQPLITQPALRTAQ